MKMSFLKLTALALCTPVIFSSCATIFGRSSYPVSVHTEPSGSNISITDKKGREVYKGKSPSTVMLKSSAGFFSKAEYQVKITANGYDEQIIPVLYKLNGWYFGNILIGGLVGMLIIDPATGAMWKLDTRPIFVTLDRSTVSVTEPTLKIMDIKDVPESIKTSLVKLK
jgi:hypothetical protein